MLRREVLNREDNLSILFQKKKPLVGVLPAISATNLSPRRFSHADGTRPLSSSSTGSLYRGGLQVGGQRVSNKNTTNNSSTTQPPSTSH